MLDVLDETMKLVGRISLRRWVERTWLSLGGPAAVAEVRGIEDAQAFFERLEEVERRGPLPAGGALDAAFDELYATTDPTAPETLQLMTIHKAKGLEFDVVILPAIGRSREGSTQPLLRWLEIPRVGGDTGLLLAPIERAGSEGDALYDYLTLREAEREAFERARLLYVATTRAGEHLHLFGHVRIKRQDGVETLGEPDSQSLLALLWPSVRAEFARAFDERRIEADGSGRLLQRRPVAITRLDESWRLPQPPPSVNAPHGIGLPEREPVRPEFEWAGETRRQIGTVVHAELERWVRSPNLPTAQAIEARRPRFRRRLETLGVPAEHVDAALAVIVRALLNTSTDARGRWIFDPAHHEGHSEHALTGVIDGEVVQAVVDRTFVDAAGTRWIIDFKTGSHEGGAVDEFLDREIERYRVQLTRYARIARELSPDPVRVGLYFPLLSGWREWVP
jgi:ATP-dependent exoDNAse (exonuclease V) beta subunit